MDSQGASHRICLVLKFQGAGGGTVSYRRILLGCSGRSDHSDFSSPGHRLTPPALPRHALPDPRVLLLRRSDA